MLEKPHCGLRHRRSSGTYRAARQDEPSGGPAAVDGSLERGEDLGNSLDLVEDRSWRQPFHETDGIASGRTLDRLVVERHVAVTARLADEASPGGLATLARPVNQDGWRVGQRLAQARCEVAWERRGLSGHNAADVNAADG